MNTQDVIELNDTKWEKNVQKGEKPVMVMFYSSPNKTREILGVPDDHNVIAATEDRTYQKAMQDWALWNYCAVRGEAMYISPNSDAHKAIIEYMKQHGWGHPQCHKK